uniref:Uncharacterized protein n=1 Tax=Triticum urartu TaxID=4572 RepID=A0A8R7V3S6_TRIUA
MSPSTSRIIQNTKCYVTSRASSREIAKQLIEIPVKFTPSCWLPADRGHGELEMQDRGHGEARDVFLPPVVGCGYHNFLVMRGSLHIFILEPSVSTP